MKIKIITSIIIITITISSLYCSENKTKLNLLLIQACKNGDINMVKKLIDKGANINYRDKLESRTCLIWAIYKKNETLINFFIKNSIELKFNKNIYLNNAIELASRLGHLKIVKYLVEHGANVNTMNREGQTPLNSAARWGNIDIVKYLISKGADVNLKKSFTALMNAAENAQYAIVKYLVEHGANVNLQDEIGETALIKASSRNFFEIVKYLVEHGANVNIKSDTNRTALNQTNDIRIIRYLVSKGAKHVQRTVNDIR